MRFLLHVSLPVEKFNDAVRDGVAHEKLGRILEETKPEAAYFTATDGNRSAFLVVNMTSASDIPRLAEPWFLNFDASIEVLPVMTPQDLQQAGLDKLGKKWA
jgi:hypothetical protein